MINIVSKKIIALRDTPRIHQYPFDQLQEWLNGVNPMAPSQKRHDSGKLREIFPDLSPAGPEDIATGKENESSHDNVGLGEYHDTELDLYGGQVDDEVGPGNHRPVPGTKEQTFTDHLTSERAFRSENDYSSKVSLMNQDSNKRDSNPFSANLRNSYPQQHLMRQLRQPKIRPRNKAAHVWQHTFKV